jgi:OPA family glycerol-3-phosphate transporter-like MFS transporter
LLGTLNESSATRSAGNFSSGQRLVLWVLWITYGSFYFCRNNLGIALPGLQAEFGYSKSELGTILMALKIATAWVS